jgi:hypothetical protein
MILGADPVGLRLHTITHMGSFGSTVFDQIIIRDFPLVVFGIRGLSPIA